MKTYTVRVFVPTVYEIAAETEREAKQEAVEIFKAENNTSIDPEVEIRRPARTDWLIPKVYKGKSMHEEELESQS